MKPLLLVLILVGASFSLSAQPITSVKKFGGYQYSQNGQELSMKQLVSAVEAHPEAYELMRSAKTNYTWSQVLGSVGGGLLGWPLGTAIAGGEPNWALAGIGAGLIVIGIPFSSAANKKSQQAVQLYNSDPTLHSYHLKPQWNLSIGANGLGVALHF
jgi:outer membrane lipoprotein SlyB